MTRHDDDKDKGLLRDGETRRVTKMMRDGLDNSRVLLADGRSISSHKPGWAEDATRGAAVGARNKAVEDAYAARAAEDACAWQGGDKEFYEKYKEGTACTVSSSEYATSLGEQGVVRNGKCVPISLSNKDQMAADQAAFVPTGDFAFDSAMAEALIIPDARERAYRIRDLEDQSAWRNHKR